jgi:hypothetical protein
MPIFNDTLNVRGARSVGYEPSAIIHNAIFNDTFNDTFDRKTGIISDQQGEDFIRF